MLNHENKYFWDNTEKANDIFKLRRIFEYASFPDLIKTPFDLIRKNIDAIELKKLRTSESRIKFLILIKNVAHTCQTWEEAILSE